MLQLLLALATLVSAASAATPFSQTPYCNNTGQGPFRSMDEDTPAALCVLLWDHSPHADDGPGVDRSNDGPRVYPFYPTVDQFSMMTLDGSGELVAQVTRPERVWVQVEFDGVVSPPMALGKTLEEGSSYVRMPYWTSMIALLDGVLFRKGDVISVNWDTGCPATCDSDACVPNYIASNPANATYDVDESQDFAENPDLIPTEVCGEKLKKGKLAQECGGEPCDLGIYIVWQGTDSGSTGLTSSSLRISELQKYSFGSVFAAAKKFVSSPAPRASVPSLLLLLLASAVALLL